MLIPAVVIAFSRLYLYVHYPSDVVGGIVVGIISGWLSVRLFTVFEQRRCRITIHVLQRNKIEMRKP